MSEANSALSFTERFKFNITVKILFPRLISRTLTTFVEALLGFVGFGTPVVGAVDFTAAMKTVLLRLRFAATERAKTKQARGEEKKGRWFRDVCRWCCPALKFETIHKPAAVRHRE